MRKAVAADAWFPIAMLTARRKIGQPINKDVEFMLIGKATLDPVLTQPNHCFLW